MAAIKSSATNNPVDPADAQQLGLPLLLITLRCWWLVTIPLGILMAAGAGVAVFFLVKPKYTAAAWIVIHEKPDQLLATGSNDDSRKYVQNQIELMRNPLILEPIASLPTVAKTPEFAQEPNLVMALRKQLKIRAQGQSDYFVIEFTSTSPECASTIANEVAKAYLGMQSRNDSRRSEKIMELLKEQHVSQQGLIKTYRENLSELSKQATGKDPFAVKSDAEKSQQVRNPAADLNAQLINAEVEHEFLKAQIQAEREMPEEKEVELSQSEIDRHVDHHPKLIALQMRIEDRQAKVREHAKISVDVKTNPVYEQLQKEIAADEAAVEQLKTDLTAQIREQFEKNVRGNRKDLVVAMERKLKRSAVAIQFLKDRLQKEISKHKEFKGETLELEFVKADHARAAEVFDRISDRIVSMQLEQRAPGRVELIKEANLPTKPDEAIPYKKIGIAAFGAFFVPFGLAVVWELLHRRVSGRAQLESGAKIPIVAEVTSLPRNRRTRLNGNRENRELQLFEESVDSLRTYLLLVESLRGLRTLAITSATSGEGKTSLACQLASSLSRATGERTLIIDGDMRSPDVHRVFDLESGPGLAEVLAGEISLKDAIQSGGQPNLHVLSAGRLTCSPHRLLNSGVFSQVLAKLSKVFRYIIIDTPPVLAASEALILASSANAALVSARRDYSRVDQVEDACARLKAAGAHTAGAVLSGIPIQTYAAKYGAYYYDRDLAAAAIEQESVK